MKILIFGGGGMLGHKLVQNWREKFDVWTTLRGDFASVAEFNIFKKDKTIENVDVENAEKVAEVVEQIKPDVIVNAVGIIKQLDAAGDVIKSLNVNSIFPHRLRELAKNAGARLICISTDCVFSGKKGNYNEDDTPDAYDIYGKSKNLGEVVAENCLTVRTSIIGRELRTAHSLVEWFLSTRGKTIKGYKQAIFSGFPTIVFAEILADVIENHKDLSGLFHVSSEPIDKYGLLNLLKNAYGVDVEIEPSDEVQIDRSLDSTKFRNATSIKPPSWAEMIEKMASDPTPYDDWRNE
jgi:dTDP-4-dehydrorhamnose reductase